MNKDIIQTTINGLKNWGVKFQPGLSEAEFAQIESKYHFIFPPDLKTFLGTALPISKDFLDWRNDPEKEIIERLERPFEGMCFDITNNEFWLDGWGEKPDSDDAACEIARTFYDRAPKLVPIYSNGYIPDRPHEAGNPVLSVHQTDIIYYGRDLFDYFANAFFRTYDERHKAITGPYEVKPIDFWDDVMEMGI